MRKCRSKQLNDKRIAAQAFLLQLSTYMYIIVFLSILATYMAVAGATSYFIIGTQLTNDVWLELGMVEKIVIGVMLVPIIETWLALHLPYKLLRRKIRLTFILMLSSIIFGLMHLYSISYIITTVGAGFILAYSYALKLNTGHAFWITSSIHTLYNLYVFVTDFSL